MKVRLLGVDQMFRAIFALLVVLFCYALGTSGEAKKAIVNSPLTVEQQAQVKKANSAAKSGKAEKAATYYTAALSQATTVEQCLAIAQATERYGALLVSTRRACLERAISVATKDVDLFSIALRARQYQFYEITKKVIDIIIAKAESNEELFSLAHKCQEVALGDVSHLAMEKALAQTKTIPEALTFAKQAKVMNMDDLLRKTVKDLIDDQTNVHDLCTLLIDIEPLQLSDLDRYLLKKAVNSVKTPNDCKEVFEMAKRYSQQDIIELAAFRGRKMLLMEKYNSEQAQLRAQQEQAARELETQNLARQGLERQNLEKQSVDQQNTPHDTGPGF
jgi:hypothetical protein